MCSPIDGTQITALRCHTRVEVEASIARAAQAFLVWRDVPAPQRGTSVRLFGEALRVLQEPLAHLVTIECGKILAEARGEVQEMIDMCDFAVGLSRQLYGLTIAVRATRAQPARGLAAAWSHWGDNGVQFSRGSLGLECSASAHLRRSGGLEAVGKDPPYSPGLPGDFGAGRRALTYTTGQASPRLAACAPGACRCGGLGGHRYAPALISATGSCRMGRLWPKVAARLGRSLLELSGNNGVIVSDKADLEVAVPAILFGAVGTCGQRCTTIRRVLAHVDIYDEVCERLTTAYRQIATRHIGNPLNPGTLVAP